MKVFKRISSRVQSLQMSTNLSVTTKDWQMKLTHMSSQYVSRQGVFFEEPSTEIPEGCILFSNDGSWGGAGSMLLSKKEPTEGEHVGWKLLPFFFVMHLIERVTCQISWREVARLLGNRIDTGNEYEWSFPKLLWATVPMFPIIAYTPRPLFAEWRKSTVKISTTEVILSEGDKDQDDSDRERVETAFYRHYLRHPAEKPFESIGYRKNLGTGLYEPYELVPVSTAMATAMATDEDIW